MNNIEEQDLQDPIRCVIYSIYNKIRYAGGMFLKAARQWYHIDPLHQSAAIAYYAVFSLPGLMAIIISAAAVVAEKEKVKTQLFDQIRSYMGPSAAQQIQAVIESTQDTGHTVLATLFGVIAIVFGATGVFAELKKCLNMMWQVQPLKKNTKTGILHFFRTRLLSFGLILSISFLILVSLVASSVFIAIGDYLEMFWPSGAMMFFQVIQFGLSIGFTGCLFALMFRFLPDARVGWRYIWPGALFTAVLFEIGKFALGFYFGKSNPGSAYGAAGSVVLILIWIAYSSAIILYGAEVIQVYVESCGKKICSQEFTRS